MTVSYGYTAVIRQSGGPVGDLESSGFLGGSTQLLRLDDGRIVIGYSAYNLGDTNTRVALTDASLDVFGSALFDGAGSQFATDIAQLGGGRIAFAYGDSPVDQASSEIRAGIFTTSANGLSTGIPSSLSGQLPVPATFNSNADIAATQDGGFIAAWQTRSAFGDPTDLEIAKYAVDATTGVSTFVSHIQLGGDTIGGSATDSLFAPSLISLASGGFEITFVHDNGSGQVLQSQRLNADGSLDGAVATIDSGATMSEPVLALLPGGGWAVVYAKDGHIFGRIYAANGAPATDVWQIDTYPSSFGGSADGPVIDVFDNGYFEIGWESWSPNGLFRSVWGQLYTPTGEALSHPDLLGQGNVTSGPFGLPFPLNINSPALAALDGTGEFVTAWFRTIGRSFLQDLDATRFGFDRIIESDGAGDSIDASTAFGPDAFAGAISRVAWIEGHGGDDHILGTGQRDIIAGGAGSDYVEGGGGDDVINGDGGAIIANQFTEFVEAPTDGNDVIFAGAGQDAIYGSGGDDVLIGNADIFAQESDILDGGSGNDTFYAEHTDFISGGAGTDYLYVVNSFDMNLNLSTSSIEWVKSDFGNDTFDASGQTSGVTIYASGGNDVVTGGSGNDVMWGENGDDTLVGGAGDDVLFGALGSDSQSGGDGDDRIYADSSDTLVEGGAGFDTLYLTAGPGMSFDLQLSGFEWIADFAGGADTLNGGGLAVDMSAFAGGGNDVVFGGSANDFLWGEGGDDTIAGNDGGDTLVGGIGADVLTGGAGIDAIFMNSGGGTDGALDRAVFGAGWGTDFVFDFVHGEDKLDLSALGTSFVALTITNTFGHAYISIGAGTDLIAVANNGGLLAESDFIF